MVKPHGTECMNEKLMSVKCWIWSIYSVVKFLISDFSAIPCIMLGCRNIWTRDIHWKLLVKMCKTDMKDVVKELTCMVLVYLIVHFNLSTEWKWVISRETDFRYPLFRTRVGRKRVSGRYGEMKWNEMKWNEMFIDHSVDPYMGRSPIGCRARQNT
jgi:hypothetical protein